MYKESGLWSLLIATGSFIGGVTLGVLLTPKNGRETRSWVSDQASEVSGWVDQQRKDVHHKGQNELQRIRQNVHHGIQHNIPNLYEATERINLSDHELTGA
jgi:gas vesicle protein